MLSLECFFLSISIALAIGVAILLLKWILDMYVTALVKEYCKDRYARLSELHYSDESITYKIKNLEEKINGTIHPKK